LPCAEEQLKLEESQLLAFGFAVTSRQEADGSVPTRDEWLFSLTPSIDKLGSRALTASPFCTEGSTVFRSSTAAGISSCSCRI